MAYTTINKSTDHFNTKLYTGNGSAGNAITGVGFQPDFLWIKNRSQADWHQLFNSVRGASNVLYSNETSGESSASTSFASFDSDGFTVNANDGTNGNGENLVAWNWKAGGTAPEITYAVKVVSDSGNKFRFDDFGSSAVTLDLQEGGVYTFDQSDSSNSGHPLRFSTTSDGTHGGGSAYTTGVVVSGTPGSSGAKTVITVAGSAPTLYYYCANHSGMGGQANTNSTFGSSNFAGSIQSTVSANTIAGVSVVKWDGNGVAGASIGHGLGDVAKMIIVKRINTGGNNWTVYHASLGNTHRLELNTTTASTSDAGAWNNQTPTSTVFYTGNNLTVGNNGSTYIAYCFTEKTGFSKISSYAGNQDANGTFVFTGFKPAFVLSKDSTGAGENWFIHDDKRDTYNPVDTYLRPNLSNAEGTASHYDFLSNGFKNRYAGGSLNSSGRTYIYYAIGQAFVGSNNIVVTAR